MRQHGRFVSSDWVPPIQRWHVWFLTAYVWIAVLRLVTHYW